MTWVIKAGKDTDDEVSEYLHEPNHDADDVVWIMDQSSAFRFTDRNTAARTMNWPGVANYSDDVRIVKLKAKVSAPAGPRRANFIGAPQFFNLNQACRIIEDAFDFGYGTFLVGSSLTKRDFRDVDLRCIIPDEHFARLFPGAGEASWRHPLWSLVCSSISLYLSERSGLPVDFQIQPMTEANRDYGTDSHKRSAMGIFMSSAPKPAEATA